MKKKKKIFHQIFFPFFENQKNYLRKGKVKVVILLLILHYNLIQILITNGELSFFIIKDEFIN